jgi:DNA-binding CsgD family transcriptional regulator
VAELTKTERRIASLAARGQTNQEIAARLLISPKTVEWNLTKIYRKLRVRSRTELAARFLKAPTR